MTTPVHDPALVRLGKHGYAPDRRTLRLAAYLTPSVPTPPDAMIVADQPGDAWGMLGNDDLGDCTLAAASHMIQAWLDANRVEPPSIPTLDAAARAAYWATGTQDDGREMIAVLRYWRSQGVAQDHASAFVHVDPKSRLEVKTAVYLFGGVYLGVQLPTAAQHQSTWTGHLFPFGRYKPGSWGGHAVNIRAYDPHHVTLVTWGASKRASWRFVEQYADEAWAVLDPSWLADGKAPNGFDTAALERDLAAIGASS